MRHFALSVLCGIGLLASAAALEAQTTTPPPADPAITTLSVIAIAVVSGVGPLLQNSQTRRATAVSLGAMSLGGP